MKKQTGRVAFGGIVAALSLVILLLGGILPTAEIALPALAGFVLLPVVVELGKGTALTVYGAVSVLSLLLVPSWEPKMLYVAFFGYYPVLKAVLESRLPRVAEWAVKLGLFNLAAVASYWVLLQFLGLPKDTFTVGGTDWRWGFLLAGNVIFILFDVGLTQAISTYLRRWSPQIRRLFCF